MAMARDLGLDSAELQETASLLVRRRHCLEDEIARQPNAMRKTELQGQLALLERLLEWAERVVKNPNLIGQCFRD